MPKAIHKEPIGKSLFNYLSKWKPTARNESNLTIIFTHRQADPDALCSAYAISEFLSKRKGTKSKSQGQKSKNVCKIIAPQGASILGSSVCRSLSITFQDEVNSQEIENASFIVLVDVGNANLLEPYLEDISKSAAAKILIDHHSSTKSVLDKVSARTSFEFLDRSFVDEQATSTCEIVALGYPEKMLDSRLSLALLVGLLFDSQHLGIASSSTLEAALKLVKIGGARIDEAKELLRAKPDRSETIARFKSAQRLGFTEIGKYFVAQSEVSSFQASVARMLVDIGSDVGIAYGEQREETRISVRASQRFFRETSIDMGSLLSKLSKEMSLTGGGHSTAASISGNKPPTEIVRRIISDITSALP